MSKHRHILEPQVSRFLVENGLSFEYPEGKDFAVCLTHYRLASRIGSSKLESNCILWRQSIAATPDQDCLEHSTRQYDQEDGPVVET